MTGHKTRVNEKKRKKNHLEEKVFHPIFEDGKVLLYLVTFDIFRKKKKFHFFFDWYK